jgi:hypothetical protein
MIVAYVRLVIHILILIKKKKKNTYLILDLSKYAYSFFIRYVLPCVHAAPIAAVSDYDIAKDTLGDPAHMLQWLVRCVLESIDPKSRGKTTKAVVAEATKMQRSSEAKARFVKSPWSAPSEEVTAAIDRLCQSVAMPADLEPIRRIFAHTGTL